MIRYFITFLIFTFLAFAQKDVNTQKLLNELNNGNIDYVKKELNILLKKYPNDPGLLYIKARITENANEAVKIYNEIYIKYPKSEWADDAIYRVYQYYSITDNTKLANEKLNLLKTKYPKSHLLEEFKENTNKKNYYVQLGAFSSKERAQTFLEDLKESGFNLIIKPKSIENKTLYTVLSNKFTKLTDAEKFQKNIESKFNIASIIITDQN